MDPKAIFDGFDPREHEEEAKERWGDTEAYKESARRTSTYTAEDWKRIRAELDTLLRRLADRLAKGIPSNDNAVVGLAEDHRRHIDRWYYPCSPEMHTGLAQMYVEDERFRATFEKHGEGLADYIAEAIRANAAGREPGSA